MLNRPIAKIGSVPLFWLRERDVQWFCRECGTQVAGTVCFEMHAKIASKKLPKDAEHRNEALKIYLCLDCAMKYLDDALMKMKMCKNLGVDGYRLMSEA